MSSKNKPVLSGQIHRRQLLKFLGLSGLALSSEKAMAQIRIVTAPDKNKVANGMTKADVVIKLLRPQDLLSMELHFLNFSLSGNQLIKKGDPALMRVVFQPQSIAESCGTEKLVGDQAVKEIPSTVKMLLSNESRLVFKINKNLALDVKELLAWENFELVVNERAKAGGNLIPVGQANPKIDKLLNGITSPAQLKSLTGLSKEEKQYMLAKLVQPAANSRAMAITNISDNVSQLMKDPVGPPSEWETSLEIPIRLFLSPSKNAGWSHSKKLNSRDGIINQANRLFELWHTRMGLKTNKGIDDSDLSFEQRTLRVLWGTQIGKDYKDVPDNLPDPYLGNTAINNFNRHRIVHESSNFQISPDFIPQPVKAYKLFLSTLGAYLDSIFLVDRKQLDKIQTAPGIKEANSEKRLSLLKWRHIQTLAREHYVELVDAGNIMPFGHEAVLIDITERKPNRASGTAPNFKRRVVVITEPVKQYSYKDVNGKFKSNKFCFSNVELLTTATPLLDSSVALLGQEPEAFFIMRSNKNDVDFKLRGEDMAGNIVDFRMSLVYISNSFKGGAGTAINAFNDSNGGHKLSNLNGQKMAFIPKEEMPDSGVMTFATDRITFSVKASSSENEVQGFLPELKIAHIIEPSYQRLTGYKKTTPISLVDYPNIGKVFAKFEWPAAVNFAGNADKMGGFVTPNFTLVGLSQTAGAFGGVFDDFVKNGKVAADKYFEIPVGTLPLPALFGVFELKDILDFANEIPVLKTDDLPSEITTSYQLKANLKGWPLPGDKLEGIVKFSPKSAEPFTITTTISSKKGKSSASAGSFSTKAKMDKFDIVMMSNLITIHFLSIEFTASPGKSADIQIEMAKKTPIEFGGPLSFINAFNELIPGNGFSDPPYLDVSPAGVVCGYTLAIPNLQLGMFTLSNLSMGAEINLPFSGGPMTMGFRFCEKHQPFTLTVSILGGGGYFGFEVDLHGLKQIDAALEFGAAVSLNLGVASGAASVMAGIYFKMETNSTQLTGYIRINGALSILGLITACIELYMALSYKMPENKAYGEARLSIKVEVLFFSKTVEIETSRTFAGSGDDPNFQMTYSEATWKNYCNAFAT